MQNGDVVLYVFFTIFHFVYRSFVSLSGNLLTFESVGDAMDVVGM